MKESRSMMGIQASILRIILNGRKVVSYNLTLKIFNFESVNYELWVLQEEVEILSGIRSWVLFPYWGRNLWNSWSISLGHGRSSTWWHPNPALPPPLGPNSIWTSLGFLKTSWPGQSHHLPCILPRLQHPPTH